MASHTVPMSTVASPRATVTAPVTLSEATPWQRPGQQPAPDAPPPPPPPDVTPAAVVAVTTPTFFAATSTVAATTPCATTPTVVALTAVATVAALRLRPAAFLLFFLRGWPQTVSRPSSWANLRALLRARVGAALYWLFQVLWSIVDYALPTDRSSAGCSDVFLGDVRKTEAFATTTAPNSVDDSSLREEAIN